MSHQTDFEGTNRSKQYQGYEEVEYGYGQKILTRSSRKKDPRLALILSSIVLWICIFYFVVMEEGMANGTDSQGARLLQPLLILGLVLLTGLLIALNIIFRRKR